MVNFNQVSVASCHNIKSQALFRVIMAIYAAQNQFFTFAYYAFVKKSDYTEHNAWKILRA